jgi:hypothetical protein
MPFIFCVLQLQVVHLVGTYLLEIQFCSFSLHCSLLRVLGFCHCCNGALQEKQIPFMARGGCCPSALSTVPGFGVHRSAAQSLDRRSGRIRRRVWPGRAVDKTSPNASVRVQESIETRSRVLALIAASGSQFRDEEWRRSLYQPQKRSLVGKRFEDERSGRIRGRQNARVCQQRKRQAPRLRHPNDLRRKS